jgi:hypothetical protein
MTSDHLPIQLRFNRICEKQNQHRTNELLKKYNLNKANWDVFKANLPTEIPPEINNDVNKMNKFIKESILKATGLSIPTFTNRNNRGKSLPKYIELN